MAAKLKIEKRGDEILIKSSPLKLFAQEELNFDEIVIGWFSSKNMSGGLALRSRWPPKPN